MKKTTKETKYGITTEQLATSIAEVKLEQLRHPRLTSLRKLSSGPESPQSRYLVHGDWTGLSQGHLGNCYGFQNQEIADEYADLLNKKNNWA